MSDPFYSRDRNGILLPAAARRPRSRKDKGKSVAFRSNPAQPWRKVPRDIGRYCERYTRLSREWVE